MVLIVRVNVVIFIKKYVNQLLEAGKAYIAFDTPEELDAKRKEIENFQYDAHTRLQMRNSLTMSKEEVEKSDRRLDSSMLFVSR